MYTFPGYGFYAMNTNCKVPSIERRLSDLEIRHCCVKNSLSRRFTDGLPQALQDSYHVVFEVPLEKVSEAPIKEYRSTGLS